MANHFLPSAKVLKPLVRHISFSEFDSHQNDFIPVIPDGMTELVINTNGYYERKQNNAAVFVKESHFIGIKTKSGFVKTNGNINTVTIRFYPGAIRYFTNIPSDELTDQVLEASSIFGNEFKLIESKIAENPSKEEVLSLVESFLLSRLHIHDSLEKTRFRISTFYSDPSVNLLDNIRIGKENYKSIEREFIKNLGVTPKLFQRILQFNYATFMLTSQNNRKSLTDVCYSAGYYDQSHFIKSFKQFASMTPVEYCHNHEEMIHRNQQVINHIFTQSRKMPL